MKKRTKPTMKMAARTAGRGHGDRHVQSRPDHGVVSRPDHGVSRPNLSHGASRRRGRRGDGPRAKAGPRGGRARPSLPPISNRIDHDIPARGPRMHGARRGPRRQRRGGARAQRKIRADSESSSGVAPRAGSSRTSRAGARGAPKPRRPPARGRAQHPEARNNETRVEEARGRRGPQRTEAHGDRLRGAGEERPDEEGQAHLREGGAARRRAMRDPVTEGAVRRRPRRQGTLGRRRARRAPLKKSRTFSRGQV